ncbi:MAG TPA: sigma-70 family RNA polymerase sigma factor [Armatimonadota bacterium]|nr:sigma-70 family RNA polymerase sigma factor [Armatimonadota bacterium]
MGRTRSGGQIPPEELDRLFREYAKTRAPEIRDRIVAQFSGLVESVARSIPNTSEPTEDLVQEGYIGLIKAVDMYDVERGVKFITYATHLILGEIKHYLRDRKSIIREPGWLYELNQKVSRAIDQLTQEHGRYPSVAEICKEVNIGEDAVLEVLRTRNTFQVGSLDVSDEDEESGRAHRLDTKKIRSLQHSTLELPVEDRIVLDSSLAKLKSIEREVIEYFFFRDFSQTEIARRLGVSCNYVSHLVRAALRKLRSSLAREEQREASLRLRAEIERRRAQLRLIEERGARDDLTGLRGLHYFEERLREEFLRAERYSHELAALLIDIDGLAQYNRRATAAAGDEALRRVAMLLGTNIRRVDVVARLEGGTFGLILPQTGDAAARLADRLVKRVAQERIGATSPRGKYLTIKAGVAVYPVDALDDAGLIEASRRALNAAREAGGNGYVRAHALFSGLRATGTPSLLRSALAATRAAELE